MSSSIQAVRGMNDILPNELRHWRAVEVQLMRVVERYGFEECRLPIVESTALFVRSIGDVTDIVEKEMYTFEDKGGGSLTLRPEGTAGCVRAAIEHGILHNQTQRLWYSGPMFRHERPQKGRYRQFYQFGVEAFGFDSPDMDAEIIAMTAEFWTALGISDVVLEINSIGTHEDRLNYREALVAYYSSCTGLDEDSQRRLLKNPLRILDSKDKAMIEINKHAPSLMDYLCESSLAHFRTLTGHLDAMKIPYIINPRLVRGLDYYTHTVFEWVTTKLGAQGTLCAGGRYDGLVEQLGGKPCPGVGFAMGLERIIGLLTLEGQNDSTLTLDAYLILAGEQAQQKGPVLAHTLRQRYPNLRLLTHCGGGSIKSQFKRADKSGADFAIVVGEDELAGGTLSVKDLRDQTQHSLTVETLGQVIERLAKGVVNE